MDPDQLLQSLGMTLGVANLRFDPNGCARLAIDGAPALDFERDTAGTIHVYSVLGPLPPEGREALYAQMLQGNLFGESTAGASLAIDVVHREVVLCQAVATELSSAPAFASLVEAFVAAAEDWQRRLVAGAPAAASTSAPFMAPRMDHFLRG